MLILLPPSEAKLAPRGTSRLDLASLSFPGLTAARNTALRTLITLCRDESTARTVLGLGPTQHDDVAQNLLLRRAPVGAAALVYSGVLFEALDAATLTAAQRRRLDDQVAISSALWGLVRPLDSIPAYRLSASAKVPGLGPTLWRGPVTQALRSEPGPIVDLRSGAYQALAPLPNDADAVVGRVLQERDGRRVVVSHHNKAIKGRLVRALAQSRRTVRTVDDLAGLAEGIGIRVERNPSPRGHDHLDLITAEAAPSVAKTPELSEISR